MTMTNVTFYLGNKVVGQGKMDFHERITVNMETPGQKTSFEIGTDMKYVEDERREYWSKNWKQVAR